MTELELEVCPKCGSDDLMHEMRDQFATSFETFVPRANGHWKVCQACGHEWSDLYPDLEEDGDAEAPV